MLGPVFVSAAVVARLELPLPIVETRQVALRVGLLVGQVVGRAAPGIDRVKVGREPLGQQPSGDREVFVMRLRQPAAPVHRLGGRERAAALAQGRTGQIVCDRELGHDSTARGVKKAHANARDARD